MKPIPPFHPHSEALMSNLASRSHEWSSWELDEILVEVPQSAKSKGRRRQRYRIILRVQWAKGGHHSYLLHLKSSPTQTLLERIPHEKAALKVARILARKTKDSHGAYHSLHPELIDKFLTLTEDS